jgi:hypothetical protein
MIPYLDHPLSSTGQEYAGHIGVPGNVVDGSVVSLVGLQKPEKIRCWLVAQNLYQSEQNFELFLTLLHFKLNDVLSNIKLSQFKPFSSYLKSFDLKLS